MKSTSYLTVPKARAVEQIARGRWRVVEDEKGWTAIREESVLYAVNSHKPKVFCTLIAVIRQLREEIGISRFEVEMMNVKQM